MKQNKSIENISLSINEVETKISDIFEQIRKKSEEIPSSESSFKLLKNLSNPTNLTNPQIIMDSKHFEQKLDSRKNNNKNVKILRKIRLKNKLIYSSQNSSKYFRKSKSEISLMVNQSCNLIKNDISQLIKNISNIDSIRNTQRNKILLKKIEQKPLNRTDKIDNKINNCLIKGKRNTKKRVLFPENISAPLKSVNSTGDAEYILEKLKNSKSIHLSNKKIRINEMKSFNKYNCLNDIYHLKLIQYNKNNKNERFQKILLDKDSQIKSLEETMKQIEKTKNSIERIYNKEYISNVSSLINDIEKENIINSDLMNRKNIELMKNKILLNKISKLKETKKNLIKWLFLQIQIKEKIVKIPKYYEYIIEEKLPLNEINKKIKNKINQKEYKRVLDYQGKNIYDDASTFFKEYEKLEFKTVEKLKKNNKISDSKLQLQNEFEECINNIKGEIFDENRKISQFLQELSKLKKNNIKLNKELELIKMNKNKNMSRNNKNNKYMSDLSNKILFHSKSDPNVNSSNYIYYKKGKSLLFNLVLFLYKWISQNKFDEMNNYRININYYLTDEKIMLNILEYAEIVVNLLLVQKKYYYSNKKLKEKYEKIEDIVDKDIKREKFMIQLKIQEQKDIEKNEKIKEKMKKIYFKHNRKIDFDYFRIEKKNILNNNKIEKRETKFEDFFYDIDE